MAFREFGGESHCVNTPKQAFFRVLSREDQDSLGHFGLALILGKIRTVYKKFDLIRKWEK